MTDLTEEWHSGMFAGIIRGTCGAKNPNVQQVPDDPYDAVYLHVNGGLMPNPASQRPTARWWR